MQQRPCNAQNPPPTRGAASWKNTIYSQNNKRQRWARTRLHNAVQSWINMFSVETVQPVCGQRRSSRKQAQDSHEGLNIPTWLATSSQEVMKFFATQKWNKVRQGSVDIMELAGANVKRAFPTATLYFKSVISVAHKFCVVSEICCQFVHWIVNHLTIITVQFLLIAAESGYRKSIQ